MRCVILDTDVISFVYVWVFVQMKWNEEWNVPKKDLLHKYIECVLCLKYVVLHDIFLQETCIATVKV